MELLKDMNSPVMEFNINSQMVSDAERGRHKILKGVAPASPAIPAAPPKG